MERRKVFRDKETNKTFGGRPEQARMAASQQFSNICCRCRSGSLGGNLVEILRRKLPSPCPFHQPIEKDITMFGCKESFTKCCPYHNPCSGSVGLHSQVVWYLLWTSKLPTSQSYVLHSDLKENRPSETVPRPWFWEIFFASKELSLIAWYLLASLGFYFCFNTLKTPCLRSKTFPYSNRWQNVLKTTPIK